MQGNEKDIQRQIQKVLCLTEVALSSDQGQTNKITFIIEYNSCVLLPYS